jgi:arsenate reductase
MKKKLLFLCTGNSCRSQMAEGLGIKYLDNYIVRSAGIYPEEVNSNAINSMKEIGIDISQKKSKKIDINKLNRCDLVITLCGDVKDKCPIVDSSKHLHWDISDPAKFRGSSKQVKLKFSEIRNIIYNNIILLKDKLNNN